jgi:hypothetical protein
VTKSKPDAALGNVEFVSTPAVGCVTVSRRRVRVVGTTGDEAPRRSGDGYTMDPQRVQWHLENWAEWMTTRASDYGRGYPGRASGRMGVSQSRDFDSMVAEADSACARAVGAILDESCTPVERSAVHHFHLAAVFRFPRLGRGAELAYETACTKVGRGLVQKGIE